MYLTITVCVDYGVIKCVMMKSKKSKHIFVVARVNMSQKNMDGVAVK